tara:strand:+ start:232 stop:666 length:435 start_codon:yes stop_codon:yes gene_type:complete
MELVYFILGLVAATTLYGVILLHQTKSSHKALRKELYAYNDMTIQQYDELTNTDATRLSQIKLITSFYEDIQHKLETDSYEGNTELNRRVTGLAEVLNQQGLKAQQYNRDTDEKVNKAFSEINQHQKRLKMIQKGEDRDLKSKY